MDISEKLAKEQLLKGSKGGNFSEIITLMLIVPTSIVFERTVLKRLICWASNGNTTIRKPISNAFYFLSLFIHMYLAFFFPHMILYLLGTDIVISLIVLALQNNYKMRITANLDSFNGTRLGFISDYRSYLMLITCFAILAVDFPIIFPLRFSKVEQYGISLMDIGVGAFIFSSGVVSREASGQASENTLRRVTQTIYKILPLIVLGLGRFFVLKMLGYQEQVTEYGTHWNFFMTLAAIAIIASIINMPPKSSFIIGIILSVTYQCLLSIFGVDAYIISTPRVTFFSHNREGILSCIGFTSIFLIAQYVGHILKKRRDAKSWFKCAVTLLLHASWLWALNEFIIIGYLQIHPSRRMTNLGYIVYTVVANLIIISLCILSNLIIGSSENDLLLFADRRNSQLVVFLIANLLTGIINLLFQTHKRSFVEATTIMFVYMFLLTVAPTLVVVKKNQLKQ